MQNLKKTKATAWFKELRDIICNEFEKLEKEAPAELYGNTAGKFIYEDWLRNEKNGGGGTGGMLRGRLFEKCGVHISTVNGEFEGEMREKTPGAKEDPRFWAAGISLIAHMRNPHVPSVHFNTRYIVTTKGWFGGGGDLTPTQAKDRVQTSEDALDLHHRSEPRGVGGIFYDRLDSGDWEADFAFTKDLGVHFKNTYTNIVRKRMFDEWTNEDREEQLIQRGRYVEFNLLWDRGTTFGLKTGGNIKTILSSMPPVVKWP